jgi:hypothetical protein
MRHLSVFLALLIVWPLPPRAAGQAPAPKLNLVVVEGEGAINNIQLRTAREPIVQVEDENHKPVAGAVVVFTLPSQGASGTFANGARSLTMMTDNQGRAVAHGLRPNGVKGQYQIHVNASYSGQTASTVISQTNAVIAGAGAAAGAVISAKLIAILAVAGAATAGGVIYATHSGGGTSPSVTPTPGTTITPGTGTVGPPR